jgi:hypothetical protein
MWHRHSCLCALVWGRLESLPHTRAAAFLLHNSGKPASTAGTQAGVPVPHAGYFARGDFFLRDRSRPRVTFTACSRGRKGMTGLRR